MIENLSRSERLEQEDLLDYKDLTPPVDDRVVDLLNHMTLEGEVAQDAVCPTEQDIVG